MLFDLHSLVFRVLSFDQSFVRSCGGTVFAILFLPSSYLSGDGTFVYSDDLSDLLLLHSLVQKSFDPVSLVIVQLDESSCFVHTNLCYPSCISNKNFHYLRRSSLF